MTNNKQKTSIEWFKDEILKKYQLKIDTYPEYKQAKAMHKEEIIEAHFEGQCDEREGYPLEIAEQYYNQTFGGNNEQ